VTDEVSFPHKGRRCRLETYSAGVAAGARARESNALCSVYCDDQFVATFAATPDGSANLATAREHVTYFIAKSGK